MNEHVPKPIDPAHLFRTIRRWILPYAERAADRPGQAVPNPAAAEAADSAADSGADVIPGVDMVSALGRVGGKRETLEKLLAKFSGGHGDAPEAIRRALESGGLEEAQRIAHTLKGVAGNLAVRDVHKVAKELDGALMGEDTGRALALLPELGQHLDALAGAVTSFSRLPEATAAPAAGKLDPESARPLVEALRGELSNNSFAARAACDSFLAALSETPAAEDANMVGKALDAYDFEGALAALEKVEENWLS